ncbi:hypothetical protein [Parasitella parasitica]|uniref:BZIP domain-containing protein n=1 Tax=Parasitella parasitica TaxID=35722 RepID=A0A0B7NFA7_9FUNG|nr:hypothetical protein [Parasitella parasitica]
MNFEDIVDMEWVDSHTTLLDGSNEFATDYYFEHQPDFLLEPPVTPLQQPLQPAMLEPEIKIEPIANMPTTEQIKQLIEIAKHQLALREQLQQTQQQAQQQQQQQEAEQTQQQPLFQSLSTQQQSDIPTAAPSTIFAPPPPDAAAVYAAPAMPALSPNTVASADIMACAPTTVLESIAENAGQPPLAAVDSSKARRDSLASMAEESISLEAYAEADGIDLKKLTPKERRQLRNKISARNFRVRRKEYISTLEGQVNEHKMVAEDLREKLVLVEEENKKLRKEMDTLKRQNQILQQQQQQKNPASPRISSSLPKPNLNKDISILGTKASDCYRQQDNCILVSNAVMPVWDYNAILHKQPPQQSQAGPDDNMKHLAGQYILSVVRLATNMPRGTNQMSNDNDYYKPLMPDDRDFTPSSALKKEASNTPSSLNYYSTPSNHTTASISSFPASHPLPTASYIEDLYDILIQSALINSSTADKSFLWSDNNTTRTM